MAKSGFDYPDALQRLEDNLARTAARSPEAAPAPTPDAGTTTG
ncbi:MULTISPECIES: hypothetical protein [unclassified Streptomyces]|nr:MULTISPECIES: hypothetical protein [unclassified Streptomyces]PBC83450.1 hypothetical protein BX261_3397 [Streptomyces sp. 2321.6]SDR42248.1 hypothetical protein SAMN05216511_3804 [Streptomyces sp. KS_16]SEC97059.1 hypothetical protein SAMN05428940_3399 [Streptomyces sp. 2133.1]SNC69528.1 hypothetical protein SAMN06272741_3391 [Streptomyces sp. 2114.4]